MLETGSFGEQLRVWRRARGSSQLDLAGDAMISARHLSFLETGRAQPSREMVGRLAEALDLPLRARNDFLVSAGFAPQFGERRLDDEELREARRALRFLLRMHEPFPAFVIDGVWKIVMWNRAQEQMFRLLLPRDTDLTDLNALDLVFEPGLLRERILNWSLTASAVARRLRRQLSRRPKAETLHALWERVQRCPGVSDLPQGFAWDHPQILVPIQIDLDGRILSWFSTLAAFGATGEVTLEELVIESFFPADEQTRRFLQQLAGAGTNAS